MKGLELSRRFYETYGEPMLRQQFPDLLPLVAVGSVGAGSDRYGFDDAISRDHDFEAGFCIFLPSESLVDRRTAFLLERAYAKLPDEFMGIKRPPLSPVGGNRNGPIRTADFYRAVVGVPDGNLSLGALLTLPDSALAEATNGEVFYDGLGEFSAIRERLKHLPTDAVKKRMAGHLLLMAQSGQYNFMRCCSRGETEAAVLAAHEFVNSAIRVLFYLNQSFAPYYKWQFAALRRLGETTAAETLSAVLTKADLSLRLAAMESLCSDVAQRLRQKGLSSVETDDLERHAYAVNDTIKDNYIRSLHILAAV